MRNTSRLAFALRTLAFGLVLNFATIGFHAFADDSLGLTKTVFPETEVEVSGYLVYMITVMNLSSGPAVDVVITDELPTNTLFSSATASQGSCDLQGNTLV